MNNYFQAPPQVFDLPKFVYKHYPERIYKELVSWADAEYKKALTESIRRGRMGVVRVLANEWSGMRILSQLEGFRWLCAQLDESAWKKLDHKTRKFVCKAYEMYELLRNN